MTKPDKKEIENLKIRVSHPADAKIADLIDKDLVIDNSKHLGVPYECCSIAAYIENEYVGGIFFRWYGRHAMIKTLAVPEKYQGKGIGNTLIKAAEAELLKQGCHRVIVDTIEYEAPDFYRSHGYELIATTPNYVEGASRMTFGKNLTNSL